jgi:hypothetical protein
MVESRFNKVAAAFSSTDLEAFQEACRPLAAFPSVASPELQRQTGKTYRGGGGGGAGVRE